MGAVKQCSRHICYKLRIHPTILVIYSTRICFCAAAHACVAFICPSIGKQMVAAKCRTGDCKSTASTFQNHEFIGTWHGTLPVLFEPYSESVHWNDIVYSHSQKNSDTILPAFYFACRTHPLGCCFLIDRFGRLHQ